MHTHTHRHTEAFGYALVLPRASMSLSQLVRICHSAHAHVPISLVITVLLQTLLGLADLHALNIVHRDVKAANVLIGRDARMLLCDLGASEVLTSQQPLLPCECDEDTEPRLFPHLAPEFFGRGKSDTYGTLLDVYSFGVMGHKLLDLVRVTCDDDLLHLAALDALLRRCTQSPPSARPTVLEALEHDVFKGALPSRALMEWMLVNVFGKSADDAAAADELPLWVVV